MKINKYITSSGNCLLYTGRPNLEMLEYLSQGAGDCWHSSFDQGYKNAFLELSYQTHTSWWYVNDFDNLEVCTSWRINPSAFAIREQVWEAMGGFDEDYQSEEMKGVSFGFDLIRGGGVPLYVKGLYSQEEPHYTSIPVEDRYVFFRKKFISEHSTYMLLRQGIWIFSELAAYMQAKRKFKFQKENRIIPPRPLLSIQGEPQVSYIIPTMMRQEFTLNLLHDLSTQTYPPAQVIIVDATPEEQRKYEIYENHSFPFELIVKWQKTKGSCRARNEAIRLCTGDYIIFGDDDIRIPPNFVENHIRLLQTYKAGACNGWDIRADHQLQTLDDLYQKQKEFPIANKVGLTFNFSNANSCVKKEFVDLLKGNDVNYDGGYGEDGDFGMSLSKIGITVLFNPYSANLHLKPPAGGYRWWGSQSQKLGKKRKSQPWELGVPVRWVRPVPSPTIMYSNLKQYKENQQREYKYKYLLYTVIKGKKIMLILRLLNLPFRILQFHRSLFYAKRLIAKGIQYE